MSNGTARPSPGERRRLPKFSLRTLLLWLLVFAMAAAGLRYWIEAKRREEAARQALLNRGASVAQYNGWELERRGFVVRSLSLVLPRECFYTVCDVWFSARDRSPAPLHLLDEFPYLRHVSLRECQALPDDPLQYLARRRGLEYLDVASPSIDDEDFRHLRDHRDFKQFWLRGTRLTDASVSIIVLNPKITHLDLDRTEITDKSLPLLGQLSQLEVLAIRETKITGKELHHLTRLPNLQHLYLRGNAIGDDSVEPLSRLSQLRGIDVRQTQLTLEGLGRLKRALPNCMIEQ